MKKGFRPKHARWVKFLDDAVARIEEGYLADEAMSTYTGISAFDLEDCWKSTSSEFASKFGLGLDRAIDQLIDLYGLERVSKIGVEPYINDRLNHYVHRFEAMMCQLDADMDIPYRNNLTLNFWKSQPGQPNNATATTLNILKLTVQYRAFIKQDIEIILPVTKECALGNEDKILELLEWLYRQFNVVDGQELISLLGLPFPSLSAGDRVHLAFSEKGRLSVTYKVGAFGWELVEASKQEVA